MRPITVSVGPLAAGSHTAIAASQSPGAGSISINGSLAADGIATLDAPRRVVIVSGGNDSGIAFTIMGTGRSGQAISETLFGANAGTVISQLDYATVTGITHTGSVASTLTAGTGISGTDAPLASSAWGRLDDYGFQGVNLAVEVTGVANYTVESSNDDPNAVPPMPVTALAAMVWIPHSTLVNQSQSLMDKYDVKPSWCRLTLNSAAATSGSASLTAIQAGGKFG